MASLGAAYEKDDDVDPRRVRKAVGSVLPQGLVPVVLDIDQGGSRYLDSVLWSLEEDEMTYADFGATTCVDLKLPGDFADLIAKAMAAQVAHARALARHAACRELEGRPLVPGMVVLRVDVVYNGQRFRDDIRWDTTAPRNTPEAVAKQTCRDLNLANPFDTAIAFAMRRELVRVALGCAAVDARGAPRAPIPSAVPRQDPNAWRPRTGRTGAPTKAAAPSNPQPSFPPAPTSVPATKPPVAPAPPVAPQVAQPSSASSEPPPQPPPPPKPEKAPRAINSYIMFSSRHRGRVAQQNPSLNTVEISRIMGELWRNMPPDEREQYEKLARDENARRQAAAAASSLANAPPPPAAVVVPPPMGVVPSTVPPPPHHPPPPSRQPPPPPAPPK